MSIKIHVKQKNETVFSTDTNWDINSDIARALPALVQQFPPEKGFNISVTTELHATFLVNLPRLLDAIKRNDIDKYMDKMEKREVFAISVAEVLFQQCDKEAL